MDIVYATGNAVVPLPDGGRIVVRLGSHWPASDPIVKLQPSLFSADPSHGMCATVEPGAVEQATAAPGEKRNARRG